MKLLKTLIELNFKFAVFLSIFGGIFVYINPEYFVSEEFLLYGPLGNNLLIVAALISAMQTLLLYFYFKNGYKQALGMGFLFILIGYDLQVYEDANRIEIDATLMYYCFYLAGAHLLFYLIAPEPEANP